MSEKMREAFEAWISAPPFEHDCKRRAADHPTWPGQYKRYETKLAWKAWQAALAEQPAQGEAVAIYMGHRHTPEGTKEFWGLSDKPMEEGTKLYTAPPEPKVPDDMAKISAIAHDGGLAGLSESDALAAIRRITAKHWSTKHETVEARRALVLAAAPEVKK